MRSIVMAALLASLVVTGFLIGRWVTGTSGLSRDDGTKLVSSNPEVAVAASKPVAREKNEDETGVEEEAAPVKEESTGRCDSGPLMARAEVRPIGLRALELVMPSEAEEDRFARHGYEAAASRIRKVLRSKPRTPEAIGDMFEFCFVKTYTDDRQPRRPYAEAMAHIVASFHPVELEDHVWSDLVGLVETTILDSQAAKERIYREANVLSLRDSMGDQEESARRYERNVRVQTMCRESFDRYVLRIGDLTDKQTACAYRSYLVDD